jgi:hypothetical protein
MSTRIVRLTALLFVSGLGLCLRADTTGTFSGIVTDSSGGSIPNAKLTLLNSDTGLTRDTTSAGDGSYEFLAVPVGSHYSISADAQGFRKTVTSNLTLEVNQRFRLDFQLVVGQVTEAVNVSGSAIQVETQNTQLGDVINEHKVLTLPLNGRSYLDLLGLQTGVNPINSTGGGQAVSGNLTSGQLSVNGQRENANSFMVNGGSVEETGFNGAAIIPTLDSIQEFRLLTSTFDAEYGHFSGAIVNVITKSGTNSFHGSVFEFFRNDDLDARNFFDGSEKGAFRRNQFGFVAGGPIRKDRLFFFVDYQGTREARGLTSSLLTVPSLSERGGGFSDVNSTGFAALTGVVRGDDSSNAMAATLSRRLGYTVNPDEPYWISGCTSMASALAGVCVFPNQIIPQSAWSPAAAQLLHFIPTPNSISSGGQPLFSTSGLNTTVRDYKFAPRVDLQTDRTGVWTFYYHYDNAVVDNPFGTSSVPGFASDVPSLAQQANVSDTKIFGPSAVNEFRINATRVAYPGNSATQGLGSVDQFGFVKGGLGLIQSIPAYAGVPTINLSETGLSFGTATPVGSFQNAFQLDDGFSKVVGKHTMKFGVNYGYNQWNQRGSSAPNGRFTFAGGETGNDFADFLLGAPDSFIQSGGQALDARTHSLGLYAQDSFHIVPSLTVNYGLRWEFSQPWYDTQGRLETFVPGEQSQRFLNSPTGWVFPGDPGIPKTLAYTDYKNFAPRVGIAYAPAASNGFLRKLLGEPGSTSIRAAAGVFYTTFDTYGASYENGDAPFGIFYVSPVPVYLELPFESRVSSNNPGQRFPFIAPGPNGSFSPYLPIADSPAYNTGNVLPYAIDMNFTIQRQLSKSTLLSMAYVGSLGRHLFSQVELNPGNAAECLTIRAQYLAAGHSGSACGPFGEDTIYSINGQTYYGTRPYSVTSGRYFSQGLLDFGDNTYESTIGTSSYHSLQVTVNKSIGAFRILGAYTFSKALDDGSAFLDLVNPYNNRLSKALSAFDMTHNFVASYSYDLPFARLLRQQRGFVFKMLGGWSIAGITRLSTGIPITLSADGDQSLCGCDSLGTAATDLPNYNNGPIVLTNPRTSPSFQYFSTDAFSLPTLGQIGTANRRFFHGPGLNNTDVSLIKNTAVTERVSIEFRAEFFNVFNHVQFNNPVGDFSSSNFGDITSARDPRIGQLALKVHF